MNCLLQSDQLDVWSKTGIAGQISKCKSHKSTSFGLVESSWFGHTLWLEKLITMMEKKNLDPSFFLSTQTFHGTQNYIGSVAVAVEENVLELHVIRTIYSDEQSPQKWALWTWMIWACCIPKKLIEFLKMDDLCPCFFSASISHESQLLRSLFELELVVWALATWLMRLLVVFNLPGTDSSACAVCCRLSDFPLSINLESLQADQELCDTLTSVLFFSILPLS